MLFIENFRWCKKCAITILLAYVIFFSWMACALAKPVDVDLVLAVDISQSMDDNEQEVQRQGYVSALASIEVFRAIESGEHRRIALTYVEWAGVSEQFVVVPKTVIETHEDAIAFANSLAAAPKQQFQRTAIGNALMFASTLFRDFPMEATRKVIDISGDGPNNQGVSVVSARDLIVADGIIINGLPLMLTMSPSFYHMPNLDEYYERCVIGGEASFQIPVRSVKDFSNSIKLKLITEIADLAPRNQVRPILAAAPDYLINYCAMFD